MVERIEIDARIEEDQEFLEFLLEILPAKEGAAVPCIVARTASDEPHEAETVNQAQAILDSADAVPDDFVIGPRVHDSYS